MSKKSRRASGFEPPRRLQRRGVQPHRLSTVRAETKQIALLCGKCRDHETANGPLKSARRRPGKAISAGLVVVFKLQLASAHDEIAHTLARLLRDADDLLTTLGCSHGAQGCAELEALAIGETGYGGDGIVTNASAGYGALLRTSIGSSESSVTLRVRRELVSDRALRFPTRHVAKGYWARGSKQNSPAVAAELGVFIPSRLATRASARIERQLVERGIVGVELPSALWTYCDELRDDDTSRGGSPA